MDLVLFLSFVLVLLVHLFWSRFCFGLAFVFVLFLFWSCFWSCSGLVFGLVLFSFLFWSCFVFVFFLFRSFILVLVFVSNFVYAWSWFFSVLLFIFDYLHFDIDRIWLEYMFCNILICCETVCYSISHYVIFFFPSFPPQKGFIESIRREQSSSFDAHFGRYDDGRIGCHFRSADGRRQSPDASGLSTTGTAKKIRRIQPRLQNDRHGGRWVKDVINLTRIKN